MVLLEKVLNVRLSLLAVSWVLAYAACASEAENQFPAVREYSLSYFKQFAPRTALDMVQRIPGFSIDKADEDRGLGQASGNVLINGIRAAAKSYNALEALARIPAHTVRLLVVQDGASTGIPGLTGEVVDVVVSVDQVRGTWGWTVTERDKIELNWLQFNASLSGRSGERSWTVGLKNDPRRMGHWGPESIYDGDGVLSENRDELATYNFDQPTVTGALNWQLQSGTLANLSVSYTEQTRDFDEYSTRTAVVADSDTFLHRFSDNRERWQTELAGDYAFDLLSGRLKFIAVQSYQHLPVSLDEWKMDQNGLLIDRDLFKATENSGESILRGEYDLVSGDGAQWQLSFEGAYNFLDKESALFSKENGGALIEQELLNGNSRVNEKRFESALSYAAPLNHSLSMQVSLGAEYSKIEQSGANGLSRDFTRPKGFIGVSYRFSNVLNMSVRAKREVGQLNFSDFVSSVDVSNNNSTAGNPALVPEQKWVYELSVERSFGDNGAVTLRIFDEEIEDIVDVIPVGDTQAVGNLDKASRYGAELFATIDFSGFGWAGGRFDIEIESARSELTDPLTFEKRRSNDDQIRYVFAELRQDIPNSDWAWGLTYEDERYSTTYQLRQAIEVKNNAGLLRAYLEHKNFFGMKATFILRNVADQHDIASRQRYEPNRNGQRSAVELRDRRFGVNYIFSLAGTF